MTTPNQSQSAESKPENAAGWRKPPPPSIRYDLICSIFKNLWANGNLEREKNDDVDPMDCDVVVPGPSASKKNRISSVNSNALKLSCELIRLFVSEAVQRAATIAEAEGGSKIEATHIERILPQFLLDF